MRTGERIAERRQAANLSQTALARLAGVSQGTIGKLEAGLSSGSSHLHKIARELGTTPAYLTGETDDPTAGAVPAPTVRDIAQHLDLVPIESIDQDYGMGGSFTGDHIEVQIHHFPRLWVQTITSSPPAMLTIARGRGDSMDPTIRDRDMVIIDRSRQTLDEQDAIWALTVGEIGMIKRLRQRGGMVVLISDNERVDDEVVPAQDVHLIGRIVFIGRRT